MINLLIVRTCFTNIINKRLSQIKLVKIKVEMSEKHQAGYMPWDRTGNRLLVQSILGKNKPSDYELPQSNFVYGQNTPQDPEKADDLIYRWSYHNNSANSNIGKQKDLIKTNKDCVKNLLHTSSHFEQFRKTKTTFKNIKEGSKEMKIKLPDQKFAYGKPLDLEDPVKLVIANDYGETDKIYRHSFYQNQSQRKSAQKTKVSCFMTKNYQLMKEAAKNRIEKFDWQRRSQSTNWKLGQFKDVSAKVDHTRKKQPTSSEPVPQLPVS